MAVLTSGMSGPELAGHDVAAAGKASQRLFNLAHRQSPARRWVAAPPERAGGLTRVPRPALFQEPLHLQFEDLDRPWIEQLPKFFGAEQLAKKLFTQC